MWPAGPYARLLSTEFDQQLKLAGDTFRYCEKPDKNLGSGRGRVRRISLLTEDGDQVNIGGVSEASPEEMITAVLARWAMQEARQISDGRRAGRAGRSRAWRLTIFRSRASSSSSVMGATNSIFGSTISRWLLRRLPLVGPRFG